MELSKMDYSMELTVMNKSYQDLLETQKDLLLNQVEDLQRIVASQCELTGVNPLSQEMAAGALSIKIGKKPRDLLNPKAVQYMQLVFSIKDGISKKETREIGAQFGVTATQVRDFFNGQRARVRKFVRLSTVKADKSVACEVIPDGMASASDHNMPAEPVPLDTIAPTEPVPLDTIAPAKPEEGPSCSTEHEALPGMEEPERNFVQSIFKLMRKEESFAGQVKLLELILRMKSPSVLNWFLNEGGVLILATWLSEAATEEQTSVLRTILKVLCHLPLKKSLPVHMSAVLQSVNRLRFYRKPDISNRSRVLIAEWSKTFRKMMKDSKKSRSASDAQDEILLKQSIDEVMGDETWGSKEENSEQPLRLLCDNPGYHMKLDTVPSQKLLMPSGEDSKNRLGGLSSHTRERRKIQMVEQPGRKLVVRNSQVTKSTASTQSRPLSTDDIQKAKMRAQFLQSKNGKTVTGSDDQVKPESQNIVNALQARASTSGSISNVRPELEERKKVDCTPSKIANTQVTPPKVANTQVTPPKVANTQVTPPKVANTHVTVDVEEPPWKRCKRIQIPWQAPPEVKIMEEWCVGAGANSKEVEVQKNRIKREREVVYRSFQEIPTDPREPWDREIDYDDSLTPVIPIEQLPDIEPLETPTASDFSNGNVTNASSSSVMPEPDLELLAQLLKNPELVFALTSGQAGNLSSNETVKLLDLIKANGAGVLVNLPGGDVAENKVEVSLPSPTPSTDPVPNGPKPDFSRNPFTRHHAAANGSAYHQVPHSVPSAQTQLLPATSLASQRLAHVAAVPPVASLQTSNPMSELQQWHGPSNSLIHYQMHNSPPNTQSQHLTPEILINANTMANYNRSPQMHYPLYSDEPSSSNSLRARQGFEPIYHHQNSTTVSVSNYNGYAGGEPVQGGNWDGRNITADRPFESWGPDDSPSRGLRHMPGGNYQDQRVNGYGPDKVMRQDSGQGPYGYGDNGMGGAGDNRWHNRRR